MMKKVIISLLLSIALVFFAVGCSLAETASVDVSDYFSKRDLAGTWDADEAKEITLTDSLTITEAGTYILSGTLEDGTVTREFKYADECGPVSRKLYERIIGIQKGLDEDTYGWCTFVNEH